MNEEYLLSPTTFMLHFCDSGTRNPIVGTHCCTTNFTYYIFSLLLASTITILSASAYYCSRHSFATTYGMQAWNCSPPYFSSLYNGKEFKTAGT
jgi:hypothetical protein